MSDTAEMSEESHIPAGRPASENPPIRKLSAMVRADTWAKVKQYAESEGIPVGAVVRIALRAFFNMPPIAESKVGKKVPK
jgi:hypothetical protein